LESREGILDDDFHSCAEQDLLDAANAEPLRILIIGKPRSGKTTTAADLAKALRIKHINVQLWIEALLKKISEYEPPDVEEGEEPPKFLTDLEESVDKTLKDGGVVGDELIEEILKEQLQSAEARTKGFVLDLSFYERSQPWATTIRQKELLGEGKKFSHIIELYYEDGDILERAENMRVYVPSNRELSRYEREERKTREPERDEDGEIVEQEETEDNMVFDELALVQRVSDIAEKAKKEVLYYNGIERSALEELLINLFHNQFIKVEAAGLIPS